MARRIAVLCLLLTAVPAASDAQDGAPPEDRTHMRLAPAVPPGEQQIRGRQDFSSFSIELPPGWRKVMFQPRTADALTIVRFEGPGHLYFHVVVDGPEHGVSADGAWRCTIAGQRARIVLEEPRCTIPAGVEPEEEGCAEGDGRLDLFASCESLGHVHRYGFTFGSTAAEHGVDLEVFRRIFRSIRVKRADATP